MEPPRLTRQRASELSWPPDPREAFTYANLSPADLAIRTNQPLSVVTLFFNSNALPPYDAYIAYRDRWIDALAADSPPVQRHRVGACLLPKAKHARGSGFWVAALWSACALACSIMEPTGMSVVQAASYGDQNLRLRVVALDGTSPVASGQYLFNLVNNSLTRYSDQTFEFMPNILGFAQQNATLPSAWVATATTVVDASWWSASLARHYILFTDSSTYVQSLAICDASACVVSAAPIEVQIVDRARLASVWDEEGIVELPLMCCVCATRYFVRYNATTITPLFGNYPLNVIVWKPADDEAYVVSNPSPTSISVERYSYGSETTEAPTRTILTLTSGPSCGAACIGGIVGGCVAIMLLGLGCWVWKRHMAPEARHPKTAHEYSDSVVKT